jgi:hypothetical protein
MKKIVQLLSFIIIALTAQTQNVGIGTTMPAAKLDVKSTTNYVAQFNGTSLMHVGIYENDAYRGYWGSYSGAAPDVDFGTGAGTTGKLHLTIQANPKLTIDNTGFVGIGTTVPKFNLHVHDNLLGSDVSINITNGITTDASLRGARLRALNSDFYIYNYENSGKIMFSTRFNTRVTIDSAGLVGIGTTNPQHLMHIHGGDLFIQSSHGKIRFGYNGSNEWQMATTGGGADLRWYTTTDGGTTNIGRHYFSQNGNVGIGGFNFAGTPKARLDVIGEGATSATNTMILRNNNSDTLVKVKDDGSVFIGNPSSPDLLNYKLRVESGDKGSLFIENPITAPNATVRILRGISENNSFSTTALSVEASADYAARFIGSGGINATSTSTFNPAGYFTAAPTGFAIQSTGKLQFTGIGEGVGKVLTSNVSGIATWQDPTVPTHNHFGETWIGNTINAGLRIENNNITGTSAAALRVISNGGNSLSRGIEAVNNSTLGIAVFGIANGTGTSAGGLANSGVVGTAGNGTGVFGNSISGTSIYGAKTSVNGTGYSGLFSNDAANNTSPTVYITNAANNPTALELNNGYIKVSGSNKTAFTITATASNSSTYILDLNYPNQAASDILLVTHNYNPPSTPGNYLTSPYSVYFTGGQWKIYLDDFAAILGKSFNVLVIKQ